MKRMKNQFTNCKAHIGTIENNLIVMIEFNKDNNARKAVELLEPNEKVRSTDQALIQIAIMKDMFLKEDEMAEAKGEAEADRQVAEFEEQPVEED